jgi:3-hydroxyisobutyrate dehydrogenase-like beta-hydroxyacid dehydrogenase
MFSVGFIGFGEAGFTIGNGLRTAGIERLYAFDIATDSADRGALIKNRAATAGTALVATSEDLARSANVLFSTVTCSAAMEAAQQMTPYLTPNHLYADLNSVSPALKRQVAAEIQSSGARFVEAAVMAPVQPYAQCVPMLIGGPAAQQFADLMSPFGMKLEILDGTIGTAAAVKMCRSIVVKGVEALLAECVLAATQFDADDKVFASLQETWPGIDWKKLADYTMGRLVVHGERRAREMEEVAETLREIGVDPIMAEATARRQDWSARLDLKSRFGPDGPRSYRDVVQLVMAVTHGVREVTERTFQQE